VLESKIQANCINYAKKLGWICCKNIKCSINGFPDLSMYKNGITIFIEFKTETGKQSELQKYVEKQLTQQNFEYWLIRSLSDFKNKFQESNLY
jgi:hypothetical protein